MKRSIRALAVAIALAAIHGCASTDGGGGMKGSGKTGYRHGEDFLEQPMRAALTSNEVDRAPIASWRLDPRGGKDAPPPSAELGSIAGFTVLERGADLSPEQAVLLSSILNDKETFQFATVKRAVFGPRWALTLGDGEGRIEVLVSPSSKQWAFHQSGLRYLLNYDKTAAALEGMLASLFPLPQEAPK